MLRWPGLSLLLAVAGLLSACQPRSGGQDGDWNRFVAGFLETYFEANPLFAVYQGRHEYDGKFPDWTEAGIQEWNRRLHQLRDSAAAFRIAPSDSGARFERDYVISRIDHDLFWAERADWPHRNPEFYTEGIDPNVYIAREYAPLPERMRSFTRYAANLPAALASVRANIHTPMAKPFAQIGKGRFAGLAGYLKGDVPQVFASVSDTGLRREFDQANAGAVKALEQTAAWFGEQEKGGNNAFALGPERFADMLRMTEGVTVPLDSLERRGREDMDRNLAALKEACDQYAPGRPIGECVQRMNDHKAPGSPVEAARRQLDTLEAFVRAKNIVSVPGTERALVHESPPYQRFNFAYIDIPGPYEKGLPSIYYISPPDPNWSKAEQASYVPGAADLLFTSVHEVWPGHFLNFLHSNRVPSIFGRVFIGYAFAEGWAHYSEEMMWEAGLGDGDPETHIGQLMNALLRNARYLSAIGMHTKGMSVAESERLFREAYQDPGTARQQAARGTYDPAYLNYTLGKLMIRKLREDWTKDRGGKNAWHDFHDRFLSYGGPPIPLVRQAMVGGGPAL
ncbi:MAG TPA: DUF885 domain-containing protein [Gemmatimonadales bacterium]|nr:DUF885 domain-containing protein [Gemmatimonadales bacterium]